MKITMRTILFSLLFLVASLNTAWCELLGVSPGVPNTTFYNLTGTSYDSATGLLKVSATPLVSQLVAGGASLRVSTPRSLEIAIRVGSSGKLIGGGGGDDLVLTGTVGSYSGTLLTGKIIDFGIRDYSTTIDFLDFRFRVTGGSMAPLFAGQDLGVTQSIENSTFSGSFATGFSGSAKGNLGPIPPLTICDGVIGDFIWNDANRNGIQDAGENGLDNVTVTLKNEAGAALASTVSGPNGAYLFTGLCAGNYTVHVDAATLPAGFVPSPTLQGGEAARDSDPNGVPVNLATGTSTERTIDFGYNSPCTGTIGDLVWHDRNRNGVQDPGEPGLGGVGVKLLDPVTGNLITATSTNGSGIYQFNGLCAGAYRVEVAAPTGFVPSAPQQAGNPAKDSNPSPFDLTLTSDYSQDLSVDFGFNTPCTGSIGDLVWNDLNRNGIQDAGEPGINGIRVILKDSFSNQIAQAITTSNGSYQFGGLCAETYRVEVDPASLPAGMAASPSAAGADYAADSNGSPAAVVLEDDASSDVTIDFGFNTPCTGSISDTVWLDANRDGIQDAGEIGMNGVPVLLKDAANTTIATTTTGLGPLGQSGFYAFHGLCAGSYSVEVATPAGLQSSPSLRGTDATVDSNGSPASVTLAFDNSVEPTLDFGFGPICSSTIGNLVWDDQNRNGLQDPGEPGLDGVTVNLRNAANVLLTSTTTAGGGFYQFGGLCAGSYQIEVIPPSGRVASPALVGADRDLDSNLNPASVVLANDTTSEQSVDFGFNTPCTGSIGNAVWHDINRDGIQDEAEPGIAGAAVILKNGQGLVIASTNTNSSGHYHFDGLCRGIYSVEVTTPAGFVASPALAGGDATVDSNGSPGAVSLATDDGSDNSIDFGFNTPCTGTIGDWVWNDLNADGIQQGGEPGIGGVTVLLRDDQHTQLRTTTTHFDGSYAFLGLCAGNYKVEVPPPTGMILTAAGSGSDAEKDSNANPSPISLPDDVSSVTSIDFGFYIPRPSISLIKLTNGTDAPSGTGPTLTVGSPVTWSYIATNTGNVELSDVTITDDKISISCAPVTLAVGASTTCTATGIAAAGQYENTGTATGSYGSTSVSASYLSHYLGVTPAISIRKQEKGADSRTFATGSDVSFEIEVKNTGDTVLTNVSVSDPLTPSCAATFSTLAVGESKIYTCTATNVTEGFTNTATVTGTYDNKSYTDSDVSTVVVVKPAISIRKQEKGADSRTFATGSDLSFEIEVKNIGESALTNVSVSDPLTPSCAATFSTLAVGESKVYTCTATNVTQGFTNTATVIGTYDNKSYTDSDTSTVVVVKPAISVRKQARGADSRTFTTGSDVSFEIEVKNIGDTVLTNVSVSDPLTPSCAATFSTLVVGESKVYTCTATNVTEGFTNTATVIGTFDNKSYTDSDASTVVVVKPAISIRKQAKGADSRTFTTGNNVPFEIEVKNIGDTVLTNVSVSDPLTTSCAATFSTLAVGESKVYTCTATNVTQGFTNTATVTGTYDNKSYTDSDVSAVVVVNPAISIKKLTNGIDAPTGTGPSLVIGSTVTWTYNVTNTGNVPLDNVTVTDNKVAGVTCPATTLAVGATMTCTATGTAIAGQYENTGTAKGTAYGLTVTASYLSHYFGTSASGCTYTQGYWKNHAEKWPATSLSLGKTSYTQEQLLSIFQTPVQGNGLISLAHQLIAAKLNLKNGAGLTPELETAIDNADGLIKYLVVPPVGTGYLAPANTSTLEGILDSYNSGMGLYGPAHCQDAPAVACTGSIGNLIWKDINANGLQDAGESGISGLTVTLTANLTGAKKTTSTNANGSYSFTGLCAGTYTVSVATPSGLAPSVVAQGMDREKDSNGSPNTVLLPTDSYNDNSVDFGFYPTTCSGSIGDRVWSDADNDGIQDSGEVGIAGVSVLLKKNGVNFATTTTDANGLYKFNALCAASYTVTVTAPAGYTPSATGKGSDRGKDSNANPAAVTLSSNSSSDLNVDFGYYRAAVCNGSIGNYVWNDVNINGLQNTGEPGILGATVKLTNASTGVTTVTTTDATGKYQFSGLCAGNYTVTVSTPAGFTPSPVNVGSDRAIDSNSASSPVSLSSSADLTVDFGFYKTPTPPQATGCSLGYWKTHTTNWPSGYRATDNFDTVFGANAFNPDITLLQALQKGGGGLSKLARQGAAALLNAQDTRVTGFPMSVSEVKSAVLNAIQTGSYEPLASQLDTFNTLGCPLN